MSHTVVLAVLAMAMSSGLFGAVAAQHQHIVVLRPGAVLPSDVEIAVFGGRVDVRLYDRLLVTIPDAALVLLRKHAGVKYLQRVILGPMVESASMPLPSLSSQALAPHSEVTPGPPIWSSGNYSYDGAGNITSIGTDTYGYDPLSRLTSASVQGHTEAYTYDAFGNMTNRVTDNQSWPVSIDPTTNRLIVASYDAAGSVTAYSSVQYDHDPFALMREKIYTNGSSQDCYIYNADDERIGVLPVAGNNYYWTWSLRDISGKVIRQFTSPPFGGQPWTWVEDYVYRDGLLLSADRQAEEGGRRQFHLDHLGTARLITGPNTQQISAHDYFPFGNEITSVRQELAAVIDREEPMKFTAHERDFNTQNITENTNYDDYMHVRYRDPSTTRFFSVDRHQGDPSRPQTWNRYSYATNNPLNKVDPLGNVEVSFTFLTWIPTDRVTFLGRTFVGDGPGGFSLTRSSYRTRQDITIETDPRISSNPIIRNDPHTGRTFEFACAKCSTLIGEGQANPKDSMWADARRVPGGYTVLKVWADAKDPLVRLAPAINYEYYIAVDSAGKVIFAGTHDPFPSYGGSVEVQGQQAEVLFDNSASWLGPWGLFPFAPTTSVWDAWLSGSISIDGISLNASPRQ